MKAVIAFILVLCLLSCSQTHNVRIISTRAVVKSMDHQSRDFSSGDTVCVRPGSYISEGQWRICDDGDMRDTLYSIRYTRKDSTDDFVIVEHRLGIIQ